MRRIAPLVALLGTAMLAAAGCAPADENSAPAASPAGSASPTCTPDQLKTVAAGKLTIATDNPAYPPWFVDNKPDNGQGFESAVAYAVATKLGYSNDTVVWTRVGFNAAIQPGPKSFDFDINEFSITADRQKAVDFSAPYYDVAQAIVALTSSKIAGAKSVAGLKGAKLGAQVGTTSYTAITQSIKPTTAPQVYNTNDDAVKALQNGQIDGLVVDLPTAFYVTSAQVDNSVIVGQLAQPTGTPEQFGLVLDKGSALTACVSRAVDGLRADGTLAGLARQWLAGSAGAPVLS